MAKYVVSYTGATGVKAYVADEMSEEPVFTFAKSEAVVFEMEQGAGLIAYAYNKVKTSFLHDANAVTLPVGLDWKIEEIK
jgi:hypothetical protein